MIGKYRAIYFDLDDTLCGYWDAAKAGLQVTFQYLEETNSSIPKGAALKAWITEFRDFCPKLKALGWYEKYLVSGEKTRYELMRRTLLRLNMEETDLASKLSLLYFNERQKALKLFEESLPVLNHIQGKLHVGLITNGPSDVQNCQIELLKLRQYFNSILIEGELGFGKPDQRVFALAENQAQVQPHQTLFVGNSFNHDILPALTKGWDTFWVRRPSDVPPSAEYDALPEVRSSNLPAPTYEFDSLIPLFEILS